MPVSGPRSRCARVHPRSCQGCQPWPRASAASGLVLATQKLGGITGRGTSALAETGLEEEDDQRPAHVEGHQHREDHPGSDHCAARMPDILAHVAVADERARRCWAALLIGLLRGHQKTFSITSAG